MSETCKLNTVDKTFCDYHGWEIAGSLTAEEIIDRVKKAGLRGFGGAGFPVAEKWDICRRTAADSKYVICNLNQQPGSLAITELAKTASYKVIEGMMICAAAIGTSYGFLYINKGNIEVCECFQNALAELEAANINWDKRFPFDFSIVTGEDGVINGEETVILNNIVGKPHITSFRPPYPAVSGLNSMPTVVNSAETLAHVSDIFTGTGNPLSKLCTVSGCVKRPGLVEATLGMTTIREVIEEKCGGLSDKSTLKAVLVGGITGTLIGPDKLDIPISWDGDVPIGSAVITVLDQNTDIVEWLNSDLDIARKESCGKCTMCRIGIAQIYAIINDIAQNNERSGDLELVKEICKGIRIGSCCNFGRNAVNPVLDAMKLFSEEIDAYIRKG